MPNSVCLMRTVPTLASFCRVTPTLTGFVTPCRVKSPDTPHTRAPVRRTSVDLKTISGYILDSRTLLCMLDCTSARSLSAPPFSGLTDSLRASTVNHTAGLAPSPSMVPPAIRRIDRMFMRGRGEQARFSDMNREETGLGVDSLFRLIGTGEDNDRCAQIRNE